MPALVFWMPMPSYGFYLVCVWFLAGIRWRSLFDPTDLQSSFRNGFILAEIFKFKADLSVLSWVWGLKHGCYRPKAVQCALSHYFYNFGPEMGPLCVKLFWLVFGGIPAVWAQNSPGYSGTLTCSLNFTSLFCICNCTFYRSSSTLRFFLCVWLAFVLLLMIFHHPQTKTFSLASFFSCKKAGQTKSFVSGLWKPLASAQGQGTQTGKTSGCCNFCQGVDLEVST